MANKKILLGMLVIALVFGMSVVSCGATEVEGNVGITYARAPQVSSVTVTGPIFTITPQNPTNVQYIVSWDAVDGDDISYQVFFKLDSRKSTILLGNGQNKVKYSSLDGTSSTNNNIDKWSIITSIPATSVGGFGAAMSRFGVRTSTQSYTVSTTYSEIKWSDPIVVSFVEAN